MIVLNKARVALIELMNRNPDCTLKSLSEAIGKNGTYLQQYIKRGSPQSLQEDVRRSLGQALGVPADVFRDDEDPRRVELLPADMKQDTSSSWTNPNHEDGRLVIPEFDVQAGAGPGALLDHIATENGNIPVDQWQIPARFLEAFTDNTQCLAIIQVRGDSMEPDYHSGERVLIDLSHKIPSPPGIYVVWDGLGIVMKRLEVVFGSSDPVRVKISSINPAYDSYERPLEDLSISGRVVAKWMWK
ncbi:S24 family peptidase [Acetobacter sp. P5B1]|uniref:S24 family peptidase n=1 Tax=Acetobacter sp. P5B1 TaxID=2762620 RepID=UPI001C041FB7|nr:S24 family peptidase [Acetobacter sp. P5B1]